MELLPVCGCFYNITHLLGITFPLSISSLAKENTQTKTQRKERIGREKKQNTQNNNKQIHIVPIKAIGVNKSEHKMNFNELRQYYDK